MASSDDESMDEQEKLDELQPVEASPQRQNVNEDKKRKRVGMLVVINKSINLIYSGHALSYTSTKLS